MGSRRGLRTTGVGLAFAALSACGPVSGEPSAPEATRPRVELVAVTAAAPAGMIRGSGATAYQRETALSFKTPGVVQAIRVDEGDTVKRGQVLASLNLTELSAGVGEAQAAVRVAESQLARVKVLYDDGLLAQASLDQAQLDVERARAAARASTFNRSQSVIVAPSDGVILRRLAEPNQVLGAGQAALLFGDRNSGLIVRATLAGSEAARIKIGDPAEARIGGRSEPLRARVSRIAAKSDPVSGGFDVEATVEDPRGLRSGLVAELSIQAEPETERATDAMIIPALALLDARADQGVVYVVDDALVARRRHVQTGGVVGGNVLVLAGLDAGERVVAAGAAFVRNGEPVTVVDASEQMARQ